jgi:hypothetical protein
VNSVILIGRLTADPQTHAGEKHESATFRLAVPRKGTDGADFVDIVTFDTLAATCGQYLAKGREVSVVGRLHLNEWTSRDGEKRSRRAQALRGAVTSSWWPPFQPSPRPPLPLPTQIPQRMRGTSAGVAARRPVASTSLTTSRPAPRSEVCGAGRTGPRGRRALRVRCWAAPSR